MHRHASCTLTSLDTTLKLKRACFWKMVDATFPNPKEMQGRESSKACWNMKEEGLHTLLSASLHTEHEQQQLY